MINNIVKILTIIAFILNLAIADGGKRGMQWYIGTGSGFSPKSDSSILLFGNATTNWEYILNLSYDTKDILKDPTYMYSKYDDNTYNVDFGFRKIFFIEVKHIINLCINF